MQAPPRAVPAHCPATGTGALASARNGCHSMRTRSLHAALKACSSCKSWHMLYLRAATMTAAHLCFELRCTLLLRSHMRTRGCGLMSASRGDALPLLLSCLCRLRLRSGSRSVSALASPCLPRLNFRGSCAWPPPCSRDGLRCLLPLIRLPRRRSGLCKESVAVMSEPESLSTDAPLRV